MLSREWATALSGGLSGLAQVSTEAPFDTIKVRLQSLGRYDLRGPLIVARDTLAKEGVSAFFQGVTPRLLSYSIVKFSLFSLFEQFRVITGSPATAGALAGAFNSVLSCPQDLLKSQLQMQVVTSSYRGPVATARELVRRHGPWVFCE